MRPLTDAERDRAASHYAAAAGDVEAFCRARRRDDPGDVWGAAHGALMVAALHNDPGRHPFEVTFRCAFGQAMNQTRRDSRPLGYRYAKQAGPAPEVESLPLYDDRGPVHPGDSPLEEAIRREEAALVRAAIDRLSRRQAEAVRGFYFEGRPVAELAAARGVHRNEMRIVLNAGLAALRSALWRPIGREMRP